MNLILFGNVAPLYDRTGITYIILREAVCSFNYKVL